MTHSRIMAFKNKPAIVVDPFPKDFFSSYVHQPRLAKPQRCIPQSFEKTLDAPNIHDNFYLNLLDWGCSKVLIVALSNIFMTVLTGPQLASGGDANLAFIWDISMASNSATQWLYRLEDHTAAVKALAWCPFQDNLFASGEGGAKKCIRL
ncbi:hypothetical protein Q3G72_002935 [Acer saccharum]|nr:hypothetical protein Q3G72_002935 [Acer saccharum]